MPVSILVVSGSLWRSLAYRCINQMSVSTFACVFSGCLFSPVTGLGPTRFQQGCVLTHYTFFHRRFNSEVPDGGEFVRGTTHSSIRCTECHLLLCDGRRVT